MIKGAVGLLLAYGVLAAVQVLGFTTTAHAQSPGTTFRDCDDCPEIVVIPAGSFMMGADENFEEASYDETPRHRVTIGRPFAIGKYEVTQAEWMAIMGGNPSGFKGRSRPVEWVRWDDAKEFIRRLNAKTGKTYRLPSAAEWEYAARAGSDSPYFFGDDKGKLGQYAWFRDNSGEETHPVGQLRPNRFGLYDVYGNVWEWVEDTYHDSYKGAPTDGTAWTDIPAGTRISSECRCCSIRGGSWFEGPCSLRSAYNGCQSSNHPSFHSVSIGFRVARTLD